MVWGFLKIIAEPVIGAAKGIYDGYRQDKALQAERRDGYIEAERDQLKDKVKEKENESELIKKAVAARRRAALRERELRDNVSFPDKYKRD